MWKIVVIKTFVLFFFSKSTDCRKVVQSYFRRYCYPDESKFLLILSFIGDAITDEVFKRFLKHAFFLFLIASKEALFHHNVEHFNKAEWYYFSENNSKAYC